MVRTAYSFFLYLISPAIFLHLWLRGRKASAYRKRWAERLGFYPVRMKTGSLIIKIFGASVQHLYLPLDFQGSVARFLNKLQPAAIIILETELWPNLIIQSKRRNLPVLVINARLSEKSVQGYQLIGPLSRQIMRSITLLASHNQADVERFKRLGLQERQSEVVGSIKFDIQVPEQSVNNARLLKQTLNNYDFVWVAGSTHPGEHEKIIAAHKLLCNTHANSLLIIAPRHPEQFDKVAKLLVDESIAFARWRRI